MVELATKDKQIVAVTAAMPEGTGLTEFAEKFPERFFDVGIAEQHGVTFAAGLATEGLKPVVAIYSTFLQRAYDQILHDVCIEALPVTFAIDRAGIVGEDGATHHGLFDLSYLRSLPNMVLMAPADENELRRMLKLSIDFHGPAAVRYPRGMGLGVNVDLDAPPLPIGKAKVLSYGKDVLILALGPMVAQALQAGRRLAQNDIHATVVNCRFVKPFDIDQVAELARRIPRIITVEENVRQGGFGSMVLENLFDAGCRNFELRRLGIDDCFVEHGPQQLLRSRHGLDSESIEATVRSLLESTV